MAVFTLQYAKHIGLAAFLTKRKFHLAEADRCYSARDVAARDGCDGRRCWVTYRDGVYDITGFVPHHPGGEQLIRAAAGGAVDSFWAYWQVHHHSPHVDAVLEQCRIGKVVTEVGESESESESEGESKTRAKQRR